MISDPEERAVISSLGWVDGASLWCLDLASSGQRLVPIGDAKYLSLHQGTGSFFAAVHHFDADRLEITAHGFAEPGRVLSRCVVTAAAARMDGDPTVWSSLPRHYVAYLVQPAWSDYALVEVAPDGGVSLQTFEWFDDRYDKDYQGIVDVTDVPGSSLVIVSVQRDSKPVIHDPVARKKVGELTLAGSHGNPSLHFRRTAHELWAADYDTVVKIDPSSWRKLKRRRLQWAATGTGLFIGQFAFDADEKVCAVARPFSGDVVGLDPRTLRTRYRAKLGKQPLEVAVLRDLRVFSRDWKTGEFLEGKLQRRTWSWI